MLIFVGQCKSHSQVQSQGVEIEIPLLNNRNIAKGVYIKGLKESITILYCTIIREDKMIIPWKPV